MLLLSRRIGESIVIDTDVIVRVLGVTKGVVRLGITAPKDIPVHREEIQRLVNEEIQNSYLSCNP